jgi:hypothetical protein
MPRAAPSPAIRILASKNIEQTCRYRNDGWSFSTSWKRIALRTERVHGKNHRSTNNRGMNYGGNALRATGACGLLPSRQVHRRAVCRRRKKRHCCEKLGKIFTNTQKPRIGRSRQGRKTPQERVAHGQASPRLRLNPAPRRGERRTRVEKLSLSNWLPAEIVGKEYKKNFARKQPAMFELKRI